MIDGGNTLARVIGIIMKWLLRVLAVMVAMLAGFGMFVSTHRDFYLDVVLGLIAWGLWYWSCSADRANASKKTQRDSLVQEHNSDDKSKVPNSSAQRAPQPNTPKYKPGIMGVGILILVLVASMGFFHIVETGTGAKIIPKASFTFANTFISVGEIIEWHNKRSFAEALRGDPQLDNLERELEHRNYIITSKKEETNAPKPVAVPTPASAQEDTSLADVSVDYIDIKSVFLDSNNAVGKTIRIDAEYSELGSYSGQPYMLVWVGSSKDGTRSLWHANFDSRFNSQVRGLSNDSKFEMTCRIREVASIGSKCDLIQLIQIIH